MMHTPDSLLDLWAKSSDTPGIPGESLFTHTWTVLARLADQAKLRPTLAHQLDCPRLWHWLYWACLLHDLGKAAEGFQAMLRAPKTQPWRYRHEVGSLAFLGWFLPDHRSDDYRWMTAAIVSHHKDASVINLNYKDGGEGIRTIAASLSETNLRLLWRWMHEYAHTWIVHLGLEGLGIEQPPLLPEEQAVALVRDHAGEQIEQALFVYRRFITDLETKPSLRTKATITLALRGIVVTADHSASAHVQTLPMLAAEPYTALVQRLHWSRLHEHQTASAQATGNIVLSAPTGSGKTESALFWALGDGSQPPPRLFYALPYQASMNAMYRRLDDKRYFTGLVGIQHGKALQALYRTFIDQGNDPASAVQQAKSQKNRTELNYYPVRVFSPYQMLKACYKLRGYEAILSDYFQAAFIFDEIHAYEPTRLALILALVAHLRKHYDARFFVMSATLPDLVMKALHRALGNVTEVTANDAVFQEFQRHRLHLLEGDMQEPVYLDRIAAVAQQGISVLVCCNTVQRAQEVWEELRQRLPADAEVVLLHSRLNGRDRLNRERRVAEVCGLGSANRQPVVLVATQVVEVSLNIDLDTLFTDLAPLEALLQRFGRVNRGCRKDADENPILVPVHVFTAMPEKNKRPYDVRLLRGTLRLLHEHCNEPVDERAVGDWLNTIYEEYAEDYAEQWQAKFDTAITEFEQGVLRSLVAFNANDDLEREFYKAFDSIEVLPKRFENEYFSLMKDHQYIEAQSLMVSIAYWQYGMLQKKGKIQTGDCKSDDILERVTIVTTTYDDTTGLLFDT